MEKKYSFIERITSATPTFFRRAQGFGFGLASLGAGLTQVHGIPEKLTTILISAGSAIALISQFAVKQCQPINTQINDATK